MVSSKLSELESFRVDQARCYDPNEEARLLVVIKAVGEREFHRKVHELARALRADPSVAGRLRATSAQAEQHGDEVRRRSSSGIGGGIQEWMARPSFSRRSASWRSGENSQSEEGLPALPPRQRLPLEDVGCTGADGDVRGGALTSDEPLCGEAASGEAASGEAASGEAVRGSVANEEAGSGKAVDGNVTNGEAWSGEVVDGNVTNGEAGSGEAVDGNVTNGEAGSGGAADGDRANGEARSGEGSFVA